jgi:hypothetical protein
MTTVGRETSCIVSGWGTKGAHFAQAAVNMTILMKKKSMTVLE